MSAQPILISIEGGIGAGKSTLLDALKERNPSWHFIDEPVGTWRSLKTADGENLLDLFQKDKGRYSYTFQNCALLTRAINIQKTIQSWKEDCIAGRAKWSDNVFVTERCLDTDYHVFAKMLFDQGMMNLCEWDLQKMWFNYIQSTASALSGIIYLSTPPDICAERITQRGREEESTIPIEYLQNLDKYHKAWLHNEEANKSPLLCQVNQGDVQHAVDDVEKFVSGL